MKSNKPQATGLQLSKSSPEEQVKQYFTKIMELGKSCEEFPIDLDDVWALAYSRKDNVVKVMKNEFVEGEDYVIQTIDNQRFRQNAEQDIKKWGGNNKETYYLSVSCLEYLIARKIRPVFEIYRQVFHRAASGGVALFGDNRYYTLAEYCQMFGKTANSFYGLMAAYREEFAMIGHTFYISRPLCRMIGMRSEAEQARRTIREKSDKAQLELVFN